VVSATINGQRRTMRVSDLPIGAKAWPAMPSISSRWRS
jgi:hypothetical protein